MGAVRYDIEIEKGATFRLSILYQDNGAPVNITGLKARMRVCPSYNDPPIDSLDCSSDNGRITLGGVAGTIVVIIDAVTTAAVEHRGRGVFDLELFNPGTSPEEVERLVQGDVTFSEEATST